MTPCLPQDDRHPKRRERELERAREDYRYDRSTADLLFAEEVPLRDKGGPRYWAELMKANLEVSLNKAATSLPHEVLEGVGGKLGELAAKLPEDFEGVRKALSALAGPEDGDPQYPVPAADAYERAYREIRDPLAMELWRRDDFFAWLAIAGCYPTAITRLTEPLDKLPVSEAQYRRIAGQHDSLAAAMAEGRAYVIDHAVLEGLPMGSVDGYDKHLCAPIGLYARTPAGWRVVGVQTGQDPSEHPLFQPGDGVSWTMARLAHGAADSHVAGLIGHFGLCHVVMEAVVLASKRNLASSHPLRVLLDAHTEDTLIVNEITRTSLTPEGGAIDRMMAPTREASLDLTAEAVRDFSIMDSSPPEDFARRGVDDAEALPLYPYRDDQGLIWEAVEDWITAYVRCYYGSDDEVRADGELAAFLDELEDEDKGGLRGIGPVETVERLIHLLARIVFRASAFHAALNYALYDFGYAALAPQAQFGPGPTGDDTRDDWLAMLPPYDVAYEVIEAFYPLLVRINRLGGYGRRIDDERLEDDLRRFQARLEAIEAEIERANELRPFAYTYSLPSRVANSIHV